MRDTSAHLNRRTFLASTLVGGTALATGAALSGVFAQEEPSVEEAGFAGLEYVVNSDETELRSAPGTGEGEEVVATLNAGDTVFTLDPNDHTPAEGVLWLNVTLPGGDPPTGFVSAELVDYAEEAEGFPTGTFVTITTDEAVVRESPDPDAEMVEELDANEVGVTVGPSNADPETGILWYPIAAGTEAQWRGWIDGGVLIEDEEANGEAIITVIDGPLTLREAPGTEAGELETLEIGEEVILGDEDPVELEEFTWIPVTATATGAVGWVAAEFTDYFEIEFEATPIATPEVEATPEPEATPDPEATPA